MPHQLNTISTNKDMDILIVGGGFAGLSCFRGIDRAKRRVTLLTDRNHFLFTPLLPLAAVGSVEVRSIVESVHRFEKTPGEILIGKAVDLASDKHEVLVEFDKGHFKKMGYQTLVIAIGAAVNTFGIPGVVENCFFLKEMRHARLLREKILFQFDRASSLKGDDRKAALCFVVVGAGATGVEAACEIQDLVQHDLSKDYPELVRESRIEIIEASKNILPVFDRTLAQYAQLKLQQKRIGLRLETIVTAVQKGRVDLASAKSIAAETVLWSAGIGGNEFIKKVAHHFGIELKKGERIAVGDHLNVVGVNQNVYAMGDCAAFSDSKGRILPQTAQVAATQGGYLAKVLCGKNQKTFTFKSLGMLASLGSGAAIADLGTLRLKGTLAWWFWKAAYLTKLFSLRNKISVAFDWLKIKFFGRSTARIDF